MAEITREQIESWRDYITSCGIFGTKPTGSDVLAVMSLALGQEAERIRAARLAASTPGITFNGDTWHSYQSVIRGMCVAMFFDGVRIAKLRETMERAGWSFYGIEPRPPLGNAPSFIIADAFEDRIRDLEESNRVLDAKCTELRAELARWADRVKKLESRIERARKNLEGVE